MKNSKRFIIFFIFLFFVFVFSRCIYYDFTVKELNWTKVTKEDVGNYIVDIDGKNKIFKYNLCKNIVVEWDSVAIIRPYIDSENLNLPFFSRIGRVVRLQAIDDSNYTLLFRVNGRYTGYSVVPYGHLDFSTYRNNKDEIITWIRKKDCSRVLINKEEYDNYTIYHVVKQ